MPPIRPVTNNESVRVKFLFVGEKFFGGNNDEIGFFEKIFLNFFESRSRTRKSGVFVDAVINQIFFAELSGEKSSGRIENHIYRLLKIEIFHRFFDLADEKFPIEFSDSFVSVSRNRERIQNENIF